MNILMVTATFPPRKFGGITNVSFTLAKKMASKGHNVTVYTTDAGDSLSKRLKVNDFEVVDGIKIYYFKNMNNYIAFKNRIFLPLFMFFYIRKNISDFDIIHVHDFRNFFTPLIHYYAKKYKIPYIIQAYGSLPRHYGKSRIKKVFDILWGYSILKDSAKVFAYKEEWDQYKKMGVLETKIEIIPNVVDLFESDRIPEKGQFKIKYGIKPEQKIILFVGRINKIKGVDLLIDAFFEITKEKSQYILVMVGPDDGYCSIIKKQIENLKLENNIIFTGTIFSKDKLNAYVDADVVVLPSEYEAFSNVILEAWSCGTLIIVSENCKLAEIVKKAGYVSKSDKFHLKEVIIFATNNEELKTKFIDEGKKIITREFNSDIIIKKIEKIYENVIMNNY